ncbi:MAG: hypothetical protein Q8R02_13590 [Hyphomonadaceae bacterium]|nr:hypothetical protein [Hyphomonadaceae bacterium]
MLVLFQLALAAGAPWGALAMGGRYPGRFPPAMRVAALVQVVLYGAMGAIVFARAGLLLPELFTVSHVAVWVVVALMAVAVVLNVITPSKWERRLWAPVALVLLATSVVVALGE